MATMWLDNPAPGGVAASVIATSFVLEKLRCAPHICWVAWQGTSPCINQDRLMFVGQCIS